MVVHPLKKQRLDDGGHQRNDVMAAAKDYAVTFDDLANVLPNILGFLQPNDIMRQRRVCRKCSEAATKTIVPRANFRVNSLRRYNGMVAMTRAMPNLQKIKMSTLGRGHYGATGRHQMGNWHKYNDGEDPSEVQAARTAHDTTHDVEIISNFSKLQILEIDGTVLNGRYPFLFSSFPLLQKLSIKQCHFLKWELEMLAGFPVLKELDIWGNYRLTGNIISLRVLKDTLEKVRIRYCPAVEGNFMDLADFPWLKELYLFGTAVTGDIRDIGENDFLSLEQLSLPKGVYGGIGCELQRISDGQDLIRTLHLLNKQRPTLSPLKNWHGKLSEASPDWYESVIIDTPPFYVRFVQAGSRVGYRWGTENGKPCEVNWLDPEPDRESSDYEKYIEKSKQIHRQVRGLYRGLYQPPVEEEYHRLVQEDKQRIQAEHRIALARGIGMP